jgi:hypothetical protein
MDEATTLGKHILILCELMISIGLFHESLVGFVSSLRFHRGFRSGFYRISNHDICFSDVALLFAVLACNCKW